MKYYDKNHQIIKPAQERTRNKPIVRTMETLKTLKILNKAIIAGLIITVLSFIISIVPCKTAPMIAEPIYKWGFCKLPNPFASPLLGISNKFYNLSTEIGAGIVLQFIITTAIFLMFFLLIRKKAAKVLDLTAK